MQIRRSPYLVHDTLLQIQNASANNTLKRPLKVQFIGEQGVDEGGVQKVHTCQIWRVFMQWYTALARSQ